VAEKKSPGEDTATPGPTSVKPLHQNPGGGGPGTGGGGAITAESKLVQLSETSPPKLPETLANVGVVLTTLDSLSAHRIPARCSP